MLAMDYSAPPQEPKVIPVVFTYPGDLPPWHIDYDAISAPNGAGMSCPDFGAVWPPEYSSIQMPQNSRIQGCFRANKDTETGSLLPSGTLFFNIAESPDDSLNTRLSLNDLCAAIGVTPENVAGCVNDISPWGADTVLDEVYVPGGTTLKFDVDAEGMVKINVGWFNNLEFPRAVIEQAFQSMSTMTNAELEMYATQVVAAYTPTYTPTVTPTKHVKPTRTPQATATFDPFAPTEVPTNTPVPPVPGYWGPDSGFAGATLGILGLFLLIRISLMRFEKK